MNVRIAISFLWLMLQFAPLRAQQVLVCDGASHFPIRDVLVMADGKRVGMTTWEGLIQLPDSFQTASFKKKGYALEKRPRAVLGGFDLGVMLDKRYRRDKRHVAQLREVFKKMDKIGEKEDPILKAYRETQLELRADSINQNTLKKHQDTK